MRSLIFVPLLGFLMGSDCDGGSGEPIDTAPPANTLEVIGEGTSSTVRSGETALVVQWDGQSVLSFAGGATDAGGLAEAWLTVSEVQFVGGSLSVTGSGTSLSVSGTPSAPLSSPTAFTVEMHAVAADGAQTDGPQVVVEVNSCVGTTLLSPESSLCMAGERGWVCDFTHDACYGAVIESISNLHAQGVTLFPDGGPNVPSSAMTIASGTTSTGWAGASGLRSVGLSEDDFELLVSWQ